MQRLLASLVIVTLLTCALSLGYYASLEFYSTIRDLAPGHSAKRDIQWQVADNLRKLGVGPNDKVAAIGNTMFHAWPRLARVRVVAEIPARPGGDVERFWAGDAALKTQVIAAFGRTAAKVIVAEDIPPWASPSEGWRKIGATNYYVYFLPRP